MSPQREKFNALISKLVAFGDDASDLQLWNKLFDDLEPSEQEKIMGVLEEEARQLEEVTASQS